MGKNDNVDNIIRDSRDLTLRVLPVLVEGSIKALDIMADLAKEGDVERVKEGALKVQQSVLILHGVVMGLSRDMGLEVYTNEELMENVRKVAELAEGNNLPDPGSIFKV